MMPVARAPVQSDWCEDDDNPASVSPAINAVELDDVGLKMPAQSLRRSIQSFAVSSEVNCCVAKKVDRTTNVALRSAPAMKSTQAKNLFSSILKRQ
jgi:hypothetical protein